MLYWFFNHIVWNQSMKKFRFQILANLKQILAR